jgi:hypothetical protein
MLQIVQGSWMHWILFCQGETTKIHPVSVAQLQHRTCLDSMFSAGQAPPQLGLSATGWKSQGLQAVSQLLRLRPRYNATDQDCVDCQAHFDMQIIDFVYIFCNTSYYDIL